MLHQVTPDNRSTYRPEVGARQRPMTGFSTPLQCVQTKGKFLSMSPFIVEQDRCSPSFHLVAQAGRPVTMQ